MEVGSGGEVCGETAPKSECTQLAMGMDWSLNMTDSIDLKTLERAMHAFVESRGWYQPDSPHPQTPRNLAISLVLEASEVLEHFQWRDELPDRRALANELADVMLYLLQLASLSGVDLGQAVLDKLDANYRRTWE